MRSEARDRLSKHGIRPSVQRVAIMQYLLAHHSHPTIEEIYSALCPKISTLSRTTVYNTLRMFSEVGAAQMITIDDHHVCYDGDIHPHVHFMCKKCGKLTDFMDQQAPVLTSNNYMGYKLDEVQLYYKGICPDCLKVVES